MRSQHDRGLCGAVAEEVGARCDQDTARPRLSPGMSALLPKSLRARLIIGAFVWITIGVSAAGVFISALFGQHAMALVDSEMIGHLEELASLIDVTPEGTPELYRPLSDPRFSLVGSGYSWQ